MGAAAPPLTSAGELSVGASAEKDAVAAGRQRRHVGVDREITLCTGKGGSRLGPRSENGDPDNQMLTMRLCKVLYITYRCRKKTGLETSTKGVCAWRGVR